MNRRIERLIASPLGAQWELKMLARQTARAFGVRAPKAAKAAPSERRRIYAKMTADASQKALESGLDLHGLRQDLFVRASRLGGFLRLILRPKNESECREILSLVYRHIGITIQEEDPGQYCVQSCYFSAFYSPEVCQVMSAMDAGIFAGVYSGGALSFTERITEGAKTCRADFHPGKGHKRRKGKEQEAK